MFYDLLFIVVLVGFCAAAGFVTVVILYNIRITLRAERQRAARDRENKSSWPEVKK